MSDLRQIVAPLLDRPLVAPPPVEAVAARARRHVHRRRRQGAGLLMALALVLAGTRWAAGEFHETVRAVDRPERPVPADGSAPTTAPGSASQPRHGSPRTPASTTLAPGQPGAGAHATIRCEKGANGGATDKGVTADTIKIFMSTTTDDPPSALAGDAGRLAFELLANVNRTGGICGRRFNLVMRNGFSLPVPDMFADLVGPLRPELDGYIADGSADRNHVPIVGTDGLSPAQFTSPWVWPMGTPARSLVRIAVDHDYRVLGARTFGLIYDGYTSYGTDVADAFRAYVQSLPGASVKMIQSTRSGVAKTGSCNDGCDAVVWAYGPGDAAGWMTAPQTGTRETDGLVFEASSSVAKACGQSLPGTCDNLRVWDPYTPAVGSFLNDPAVAHYGDAAKDGLNPLVEGSYLGVQVLIDAIRRVGPLLTQARLRAALDELRFESSLVGPLTWARSRIGNTSARALKIVNGAFDDAGGGWVADPTPGA